MGVWQRSTDFTGASGYQSVDRWRHLSSNTRVQRWDYPTGANLSKYAASISGTGTYIGVEQRVEDAYRLIGETATLSFQADIDSSDNPYVYFAFHVDHSTAVSDGVSVPIVPVSGYSQYTFTVDLPELHTPTPADEVFLKVQIVGNGSTSATSSFRLTAVKLEHGSVATPFIADDPATNLAKCQRYYESSYRWQEGQKEGHVFASTSAGNISNGGYIWATQALSGWVRCTVTGSTTFKVPKRTAPEFRIYDTGGHLGKATQINGADSQSAQQGNLYSGVYENGWAMDVRMALSGTNYGYHWVADAEL